MSMRRSETRAYIKCEGALSDQMRESALRSNERARSQIKCEGALSDQMRGSAFRSKERSRSQMCREREREIKRGGERRSQTRSQIKGALCILLCRARALRVRSFPRERESERERKSALHSALSFSFHLSPSHFPPKNGILPLLPLTTYY